MSTEEAWFQSFGGEGFAHDKTIERKPGEDGMFHCGGPKVVPEADEDSLVFLCQKFFGPDGVVQFDPIGFEKGQTGRDRSGRGGEGLARAVYYPPNNRQGRHNANQNRGAILLLFWLKGTIFLYWSGDTILLLF